jgi:hypothetical protein
MRVNHRLLRHQWRLHHLQPLIGVGNVPLRCLE